MKKNLYKFTIEQIKDKQGNTSENKQLSFELEHNEDIFQIVQKVKQKDGIKEDEATVLAIGLKLFASVLLENKNKKPFKELLPHFKNFMKDFKKA